jgi:nucleoside 2-deoxyribosyltransferase
MMIYLASRYSRRDELCGYRSQLQALGYEVTSRWLNGLHHMPDHCPDDYQHAENQRFAREDLEDLKAADVVICFTEPSRLGPGRGGRHVEFGIALALRKTVIAVGHRENVFHFLPEVIFYETWQEVIEVAEKNML